MSDAEYISETIRETLDEIGGLSSKLNEVYRRDNNRARSFVFTLYSLVEYTEDTIDDLIFFLGTNEKENIYKSLFPAIDGQWRKFVEQLPKEDGMIAVDADAFKWWMRISDIEAYKIVWGEQ